MELSRLVSSIGNHTLSGPLAVIARELAIERQATVLLCERWDTLAPVAVLEKREKCSRLLANDNGRATIARPIVVDSLHPPDS